MKANSDKSKQSNKATRRVLAGVLCGASVLSLVLSLVMPPISQAIANDDQTVSAEETVMGGVPQASLLMKTTLPTGIPKTRIATRPTKMPLKWIRCLTTLKQRVLNSLPTIVLTVRTQSRLPVRLLTAIPQYRAMLPIHSAVVANIV